MGASVKGVKGRKLNRHIFGRQVDEFKRQLLLHAIVVTGSNIEAAAFLGMNRQHFYKTFKNLGLELPSAEQTKQEILNKSNTKLLVNWRFKT